jgi:hypothetical protein
MGNISAYYTGASKLTGTYNRANYCRLNNYQFDLVFSTWPPQNLEVPQKIF